MKTGANVFLTGEPGSGKTYTINEYIRYLRQYNVDAAVTASTGIAATHLGGMTIHAWSGMGIKKNLNDYDLDRIATFEPVARRVKRAAVLVIDEISMLEGAVLHSLNRVCREVRQRPEPFGGLQVVFVGDFFQLPPVGKEAARPLFAFESAAWQEANPLTCYLSEQHRQEDSVFLDILSALRRNAVNAGHRECLSGRCSEPPEEGRSITKLFSHNVDVDRLNSEELAKIQANSKSFCMAAKGSKSLTAQLRRGCLSPERLSLKEGAVVMFTKNDPKGAFVNGTLGTIIGFQGYTSWPVVKTKSGREITAEPMSWTIDDNRRVLASITQVPLRLAWAITVHKSQGMSLDASFMDLRSAFVAGQGYVALSRVRTLSGLFLAGYNEQALLVDETVLKRDEDFRRQSDEATRQFSRMPEEDLTKLHANFIRAAGSAAPRQKASRPKRRRKKRSIMKIWQ